MGPFDRDQQPGPGRGFSGRIIGAIIIAVIAWLMYMSQVQENPVTGERQHVAMSPSQEIGLGLESAPQMARQMGGELPASDPRTLRVKRVGEQIISHTDAKNSPWKFAFHLLADPQTVNAFALPGGQIFITEGLLSRTKTDAQLAGVLSHEIGHVIERHTAQQMAKGQLGQMLVVAVGAAASDDPSRNSPSMIAGLVNQMVQLRYSRADESEADLWGIKLMSQVGYDPRAMIEVMQILKAASGSGDGSTLEFFKTHPDPDIRIKQIEAYLKEHPQLLPSS